MIISVHTVTGSVGSTVWTGIGTDFDTDAEVTFGGDWRPMADLADLVSQEGSVDVELEDWQVLSVAKPA